LDELFIFFFSFESAIGGGGRANPQLTSGAASVHITVCYLKGYFILCILNFYLVLDVGLRGGNSVLVIFFFHRCPGVSSDPEATLWLGLSQYLKCNQSDYQMSIVLSLSFDGRSLSDIFNCQMT